MKLRRTVWGTYGSNSETVVDFASYFSGMPRFSARDNEFCELPITFEDIQDAMKTCAREKFPGRAFQSFEL